MTQALKVDDARRLAAIAKHADQNRYLNYRPYPKQLAFHAEGSKFRERAFMCGNRLGKTHAACGETDLHLRSAYDETTFPWTGKRFDREVTVWAIGQSAASTRDVLQKGLLGEMNALGTGSIPRHAIETIQMARGLAGSVDTAYIRSKNGKLSKLQFKSCEQGMMKLAGTKIDVIHLDEEPPGDIYSECLMRTRGVRGGGTVYCTFTPLLGKVPGGVVEKFWPHPNSKDRSLTMMDIEECPHFVNDPDEMRAFIEALAPWELEARTKGLPVMGAGRLFTALEGDVMEPAFTPPRNWKRIVGLDLGWNHPTAACWIAIEPTESGGDILHVYDTYRRSGEDTQTHASAIRERGVWIPVAWPHDGMQHDKGSGVRIADQYRKAGVKMLNRHATFEDGSYGLEAGVLEMYHRFNTGRIRVSEKCFDFFEEYRTYHRGKDGKIKKENDDLISALRYGMMMRKFGKIRERNRQPRTVGLDYDILASPGAERELRY